MLILLLSFSFLRGCGDTYQLGHGNQDHVRQPKLVEGLADVVVTDVSVGAQHCVALTDDGNVYAWGKNSSFEVNESGDIISSPLMIEAASGKGALSIACGASEVSIDMILCYTFLIDFCIL